MEETDETRSLYPAQAAVRSTCVVIGLISADSMITVGAVLGIRSVPATIGIRATVPTCENHHLPPRLHRHQMLLHRRRDLDKQVLCH